MPNTSSTNNPPKPKIWFVLIVILVALGLLILSRFLASKPTTPTPVKNVAPPISDDLPKPTTVGWTLYQNAYGFEFRHPKDWKIEENDAPYTQQANFIANKNSSWRMTLVFNNSAVTEKLAQLKKANPTAQNAGSGLIYAVDYKDLDGRLITKDVCLTVPVARYLVNLCSPLSPDKTNMAIDPAIVDQATETLSLIAATFSTIDASPPATSGQPLSLQSLAAIGGWVPEGNQKIINYVWSSLPTGAKESDQLIFIYDDGAQLISATSAFTASSPGFTARVAWPDLPLKYDEKQYYKIYLQK
ncbi:MAG TPA: hypothetical protein DDX47_01505 [Candidatus Jacksonbacteria bacterium]|nr:MAG: hypothetical protein UW45_C0037G0009 [Parcubacteria group bacterium GW2011_GWC2_44_22]OGY76563.1 MAG: hypothetical protein A2240_03875 [Candidatus Jacksonbacteria bacterium RIFOXYA2_FULL_43_12]HBH46027.1 hypothetical protein [Candidatus Jacksonbacteria bacterium]